MKQRDKQGRYTRVYRTASRWEVLTLYSVLGGILLGIVFDIVHKPHVFEIETVEAAEVVVEPVEVLIEVVTTKEGIENKIANTFPGETALALAVAKSESGSQLNPKAYNPEWHYDRYGNKICQGSYGVMQIACVHHLENPEALFDVDFNLKKAKQIHAQSGWQPWGGWSSGGYKQYMK